MRRARFVFLAHRLPDSRARVFRRKADASQWGRATFSGLFFIEKIDSARLLSRLDHIKNKFDVYPVMP